MIKSHRLITSIILASTLLLSGAAHGQPTISSEPQGADAPVGGDVVLRVRAAGAGGSSALPAVASGQIKLWLKADAGVVTNSSGQVSLWQDQSGNGNDAAQAVSTQTPSLVLDTNGSISYPAIFFNGLQDATYGDYLHGNGDLGLSNAYTSFMIYSEADPGTAYDRAAADVGEPNDGGGNRADLLREGAMYFSAWGLDWGTGYNVPVNTTRLWTTRLDSGLDTIEEFDTDGTVSNYFPIETGAYAPDFHAPAPGYFIGGLGSQLRNYHGGVAELVYYNGYLSESDRVAVQNYLEQKYFVGGPGSIFGYQWLFNGTSIAGATNATLDLADLQFTNSGSYSVIVSGIDGSATSSNAVVVVGTPPSITSQPESQGVISGVNVTFDVTGSGSGPLSYQWSLNGSPIAGATNSTLALSDVALANAGLYSAAVTSPFGVAISSNATLTIESPPVITSQPQNQYGAIGGNVTLNVGSGLPSVSTGTLALWLNAGAGVISSNGLVTTWQDQSGNGNDASQSNTNQQPIVANAAPIGGAPVVRFNGLHDGIHGSYLHGLGDVGLSNALTSFCVYMATNADVQAFTWMVGVPPTFGAVRGDAFKYDDIVFSTWGIGYFPPFAVPTNTYTIWNDRVNTNLSEVEMFQTAATYSTNFSLSMSGALPVGAGYYIGGINPGIQYSEPFYNLPGDIAEVILYRGSLSESDRLSVQHYLQQKYFGADYSAQSSYAYQWQFDGTNIAGATNSALTITNLQTSNAGTYTVILTDAAGSTTSSNAVITTGYGPGFSSEPLSQTVASGASATFNAAVTGTGPNSFQWAFNGAAIANATNSTLSLSNITTSEGGIYAVTVSSPFGSATSSNAALTVLVPTIQVASVSASGGTAFVVPVELVTTGVEAGIGFSLNYDPTILTFTGAVIGSNAEGALFLVNSNQISSGHLGLALDLTSALAQGTNEIAEVTFRAAVLTNSTTTPITLGGQPTAEEISDSQGNPLLAVYTPGSVSISQAVLEGDVWPVPAGDGQVTISDWVEEGRLVAGLDTTTNAGELQRADAAPRDTGGDGELTVADWVQVGRYAAGLDPLTAVGFPPTESSVRQAPVKSKTVAPRAIAIVPLSQGGLTNTLAVQLTAQGGENSIGFSISFDPTVVRFINAALGSGATGAVLYQNTAQAAAGQLGFVLGYNLQGSPTAFTAGQQQVVRLTFASVSYSNNLAVNFGNTPVICDLADTNAVSLPASFQNGVLLMGGAAWPGLSLGKSSDKISLTWPVTAGFVLESSPSLAGPWAPVTDLPTTNGGSVSLDIAPAPAGQMFYRLQQQ